MKDERDPELLSLFADSRRPIEGEDFTSALLAQIEKEIARSRAIRSGVIAAILLVTAMAVPFLVRTSIASLPTMDGWIAATNVAPLWVLIPVFAIAAGLGSVWHLVRSAS